MIEVLSLSKWYGDKPAAQDLNFRIGSGEIVGLLGLNGAGKSTILKTLATLMAPTSGEARIGGFSVRTESEKVRALIGYLPDTPPLYDEFTVLSYLTFVGKLKGIPGAKLQDSLQKVMKKTQLEDVKEKRMGELSHGFRQRVNLAQALIHEPKVLILDEPINGLDPVQIVEMRDLILSLKGKHTVLLSSHILSEITKTCDRILVIDKGRLIAEGSEKDLLKNRGEGMEVVVEVREGGPTLLELRPRIEDIKDLSLLRFDDYRIEFQSPRDVRGEIARMIVGAGYELIGLKAKDTELESVFLSLVHAGDSHE